MLGRRTRIHPKVSVIMPSLGRRTARDAVASVMTQSLTSVELIAVIDPWSGNDSLFRTLDPDERLRLETPHFADCPDYLPARIAKLRNFGIAASNGEYIAHLDDDNWWSPCHLESLTRILDENPGAGYAYSWRTLVDEAGKPVPLDTYPWSTRFHNRAYIFAKLLEYGMADRGKPFLRDKIITDTGDEIFHLDTSELCVRRDVHDRIRFSEQYTLRQIIEGHGEDRVFCEELYREGVLSACSELYTLFYRLGGYSNHLH